MLSMFAFPTIVVRLLAEIVLAVVAFTLVTRVDRPGGLAVGALATIAALTEVAVPTIVIGSVALMVQSASTPGPGAYGGRLAVLALELLPPLAHATLLLACTVTLARMARRMPPEHREGGAGAGWSLD